MYREGTSLSYVPEDNESTAAVLTAEEGLITDDRAGLTPAQQVERKLVSMLGGNPLPVSQLQSVGARRVLS